MTCTMSAQMGTCLKLLLGTFRTLDSGLVYPVFIYKFGVFKMRTQDMQMSSQIHY